MERMSVTTTETRLPETQEGYDTTYYEIIAGLEDTEVDTSVKSVIEANYDPDIPTDETIDNPPSVEEQELLTVIAPEAYSNPQLDWPESENGTISVEGYNLRLNYRLSIVGFILDGARSHIESEQDAMTWVELKRVVAEAKSRSDAYGSKIDIVIALEDVAHDFAVRLNTTEAECQAARNGDIK